MVPGVNSPGAAVIPRLLVAEDEDLVRSGLVDRIRHLPVGPVEVWEAADGGAALAILDQKPIDVLVTDIRMPGVDGLGLAEQAPLIRPGIRTILVTGHAEFDYARRAIKAGVFAYLLKPIVDQDFQDALVSVIEEALADRGKRTADQDATLASAWVSVLTAPWSDPVLTPAVIQDLETRWAGCQFVVGVVVCDPAKVPQVRRALEKTPCACQRLILDGSVETGELWVLMGRDQPRLLDQAMVSLLGLVRDSLATDGVSVVVARGLVGGPGPVLLSQAREALELRFQNPSAVHRYAPVPIEGSFAFPHDRVFHLRNYFERRDLVAIEQTLSELFSPRFLAGKPAVLARMLWNSVVNTLIEVSVALGVPADRQPGADLLDGGAFGQCATGSEVVRCLYQSAFVALAAGGAPDLSSSNRIRLAAQYLDQHCGTDVTVNDLAERYAMNPSYFSTAFRKETGTTVIGYLTDVRVRKAKEQLTDTDSSIIDISHAVGYQDHQYFFRVFKKATGMTPLEFRRSRGFSRS